ncbi:MAG: GGDEF domain-containing protein [Porticoccaceae bacterium]|nr:GGDEF domain-containing protein [Porticoccaceae bacterium]
MKAFSNSKIAKIAALWRAVDHFIANDLFDYDHREMLYKARILICTSLVMGLVCTLLTLFVAQHSNELGSFQVITWLSALAAMLMLAVLPLFHRTGSFVLASNLYGFAATLAMLCALSVTGGVHQSPLVSLWPLIIIFTFIMAGMKTATLWALVALSLWLAAMVMAPGDFPSLLSLASVRAAYLLSVVAASLGMLAVLWFFAFYHDHLLARLQVERDRALFTAAHDPLTGIANRKTFEHRLEHLIERSRLMGGLNALLIIDLDGFKQINDNDGHQFGDRVLKTIATRIHNHVRRSDLAARIGGDEFAVLLTDIRRREDIEPIVEKLHNAICAPILMDGNGEMSVGASIGIGLVGSDGSNLETLLHNTDQAMYQAKTANLSHAFFDSSPQQHSS